MSNATQTAAAGAIKVWYVPQVPMKSFEVAAPDVATAALILSALESFSFFEYENRVKPDYADAGGIVQFDPEFGWEDVEVPA